MNVGKRIATAFGTILALSAVMGIVAVGCISVLSSTLTDIASRSLPAVYGSGRLIAQAREQRSSMAAHIAASNPDDKKQLEKTIASLDAGIQSGIQDYEKAAEKPEERQILARAKKAYAELSAGWSRVLPASQMGDTFDATEDWNKASPAADALQNNLQALVDLNKTSADHDTRRANSVAGWGRALLWLSLVVSLAGGAAAAQYVWRGVSASLKRAVSELGRAAEQVAEAAGQVRSSSGHLAESTSQDVASLRETSKSVSHIESMTRENAASASQASSDMSNVDRSVNEANNNVNAMLDSMRQISSSSQQISKIIRVIDEIAFQTNILALNAAVEAARAGESGMGFAVVADEVRNLAQRSAQAAHDTTALIEESMRCSEEGARRLDRVAGSVQEITASAKTVVSLIEKVSRVTVEQAQGMQLVSQALCRMDAISENAAANAQQAVGASTALHKQVRIMDRTARQLKTMLGAQPTPAKVS